MYIYTCVDINTYRKTSCNKAFFFIRKFLVWGGGWWGKRVGVGREQGKVSGFQSLIMKLGKDAWWQRGNGESPSLFVCIFLTLILL